MQPTTPRDFLKVALQRLSAAEAIMDKLRLTLEAQYIGGYSVECSFKALIDARSYPPQSRSAAGQVERKRCCPHSGACQEDASVRLDYRLAVRDRAERHRRDQRPASHRARHLSLGRRADAMTTATTPAWDAKRTAETRMVEDRLRPHFERVDSYRYNSASIRVRVIDSRFEGMSREKRDAMVEEQLDKLPPETQRDIVTLLTFAPSELTRTATTLKEYMQNTEFDNPSPTML